jgi:hypothetical protein
MLLNGRSARKRRRDPSGDRRGPPAPRNPFVVEFAAAQKICGVRSDVPTTGAGTPRTLVTCDLELLEVVARGVGFGVGHPVAIG